jgi:hypothetical protein
VSGATPVARRFPLRFGILYFGLYACATQLAGGVLLVPGASLPPLGHVWPMRDLTSWLGVSVVGLTPPLVYTGNSGDTAFHWVQLAWIVVTAGLAAAAWASTNRPRVNEAALYAWMRLALRFVLAAQMFYYGLAKIIPTQFQAPSLVTLVQPVGTLSLADLLWTFIGASTAYQMLAGVAEVAAGVLLVVPRTAMLGAWLCIFDMTQVFALNMAYDFGLKQLSFHLIAMAAVLVAPDLPRLADFFLRRQAAGSLLIERIPGVTTPWARHTATWAQLVFGLYLLVMFASLSQRFWVNEGDGRPRSPVYGIWEVVELRLDGRLVAPADADYDRRWRRVIFDTPEVVAIQRTDDSVAHYGAAIDAGGGRVRLSKGRSQTWRADFEIRRTGDGELRLAGEMDGLRLEARLRRVELDTFRLRESRFRWIRPPDPFAG